MHPDWPKKVAKAKTALAAFDQLPLAVRRALSEARAEFSAEQMLGLWKATDGPPEGKRIKWLLDAIKVNDRPAR